MAVTYQQVLDLMPDGTLSSAIVTSIIGDATVFVTATLVGCTVMSPTEIDAIIKWYTAHMIASGPYRQTKREKLGEAEVEYDSQAGSDLSSTTYGKMVLLLDRCGKLKSAGKQAIVLKAITSFE